MSLGYAEKLSYIEDVGNVGMSEIFDPPRLLQEKIERLATMIRKSKHLVVFTGAGISTSCGIPDFRGPNGIWTLQATEFVTMHSPFLASMSTSTVVLYEKFFCLEPSPKIPLSRATPPSYHGSHFALSYWREGKALPEASLPFHRAMPSMTHMALVELEKAGILKYVISQNIDGLHLRSGIPREKLSELHGNSFMEICPSCGLEYMRDFEVETIGLKETSRRCSSVGCGAKLKDTVLDWEDALPSKEMDPAEKHCRMADVVLCLGTSLQITPACNLPLKSLRGGGKIVIVNLQKTPKDKKASMVIHGLVDKVIAGVIDLLNLRIPPFVRIDLLQIIFAQPLSLDKRYVNWNLRVASVHGKKAPLPFIKSVEVSFSDTQNMKEAVLHKEPLQLKRRTLRSAEPFDILLKLNFSDGCRCSDALIKIPIDFKVPTDCFKRDKDSIFQTLRERAIQDLCCGQHVVIDRETVIDPESEVTVYAIVTDLIRYEKTHKVAPAPAPVSNGTKKRQDGDMNWFDAPRKKRCKHKGGRR